MKLPDLTERLKAEIPDHKLDELCTFLVRNVNRSRGVMATNYETWDRALDIYRSVVHPDASDIRARRKNAVSYTHLTLPTIYSV